MKKFVLIITAISFIVIMIAFVNSHRRQDGILTAENTISLPDSVPATPETEPNIIHDYTIQNNDEYITLKTWGTNFTEQKKDGDVISIYTYANNISAQYNIIQGVEDILERLKDIVENDKKTKSDYKYEVKSVHENKNTVWAYVEYENEANGEKGGSVLFVRQLANNVLNGNISYFIDCPRKTLIAKQDLVDTFVKACGLTGGATIDLYSPDYSLYKTDLPVTAYSWQENQQIDEKSLGDNHIASFRSDAKGVFETVDVYKGNTDAYQEVKNYLISAMQHDGLWFSSIDNNKNFAYVIFHYNLEDNQYDSVIYLVENEFDHYKTVVITASKDSEQEILDDIMNAYQIENRPTVYSLDELKKISSVFKGNPSELYVYSDEEILKRIPEYSNLITAEKVQHDAEMNTNQKKKDRMKNLLLKQLIKPTYDIPILRTPVQETVKHGTNGYREGEMKVKEKKKKK